MKTASLLILLSTLSFSAAAKDLSTKCIKGKTQYSCSAIKKAKRDYFCSSRKYSKRSIEKACKRTPRKSTSTKKKV